MKTRASGILMHVTSLPSRFGIGDLGPEAYRFVDFLAASGQSYWQVLPIHPTDPAHGNSPYNTDSAFAGNHWLISPELLVEDGLLFGSDLDYRVDRPDVAEYDKVVVYKNSIFDRAYERFRLRGEDALFNRFCQENAHWLDDYALFSAIKKSQGGKPWSQWPDELRHRDQRAIQDAGRDLARDVGRCKFLQFVFNNQWKALRGYCKRMAVCPIGDMPIYVQHDSADVWSNPDIFKLDGARNPYVVAGVPPDYFSATGQLWGNPLYNWEVLAKQKYSWWVQRFQRALDLVDFVRIDHFRGLVGYWEIPAHERTAINGRWIEAPANDFFGRLARVFPSLPFIAEDLGVITPDVNQIIRRFSFPGMKVLLFAFGDDPAKNPFAPHNHFRNCVVYTGTHDNNTVRGWYEREAGPEVLERLHHYLGRTLDPGSAPWTFIRMAMASVANTVLIPLQDILGLGGEARMNIPGAAMGNWTWRLAPGRLTPALTEQLMDVTKTYGRA